jgi:dCMP deaminase
MIDYKWNFRFMELAKLVSTWSKDPSTKIGAVIVNPTTKTVVGMGYNGFPRGVVDYAHRYTDRDEKLKLVVHAEVNAILNATQPVKGCWLYVYPTIMEPNCCNECCKYVVQSGIAAVLGLKQDTLSDRWQKLAKYSKIILEEGGVEYISI